MANRIGVENCQGVVSSALQYVSGPGRRTTVMNVNFPI